MRLPDPALAPAQFASRLFADQAWARDKLAPFAGRAFKLNVGPLHAAWRIGDGGTLDAIPSIPTADLELAVSPWSVPSFLANPTRWNEFVVEVGDPALGGALKEVAHAMPWFVEELLAQRLGPVLGQRVADTGRQLLAFPEYASARVTESVVSYGRDEAELLARGDDARRHTQDVEALVISTDALLARVAELEAQYGLPPKAATGD